MCIIFVSLSLSISVSLSLSPSHCLSLACFLFLRVVRCPDKGERALCVPILTETSDTTSKQAVETVTVFSQRRDMRTLFHGEEDTIHYKSNTMDRIEFPRPRAPQTRALKQKKVP